MIDYYNEQIIRWAIARNLIEGSTPTVQFVKLVEEIGELSRALTREGSDQQAKEVGDCLVLLSIICEQLNLEMEECIAVAYNSIKDRKGKMVNGIFIKEQDL